MWPWQYLSALLKSLAEVQAAVEAIAKEQKRQGMMLIDMRFDQRLNAQDFRASLKFLKTRAAYVGPLKIEVTGESEMSLKFKVALPPITASDVVSGELSVKIDSGEPIVIATTKDQTEVEDGQLSGRDGATVELSYVLIDDAGNRSEPSVFVGQLTDTIAPPKPGELALAVTEEVND